MDGISTSRNLQASHEYTRDRSLTKPRGSEPGGAQEQVSPAGMPQTVEANYRVPPTVRDWWIFNILLYLFSLLFTTDPGPSHDKPQQDSPERPANSQPAHRTGGTITNFGNNNRDCGNVTNSNNTTYNNAEKIYGGGARNDFSGANFY